MRKLLIDKYAKIPKVVTDTTDPTKKLLEWSSISGKGGKDQFEVDAGTMFAKYAKF